MAFQTIYEYTGTQYGRTVTVQIQEDSAGTLTKDDIEITGLSRRGGSESNNISEPIIGQIFTADIVDRNWTNNGSIYDKVRTQSDDLRVLINIGGNVWYGFVALTSNRRSYEPAFNTYEITIKMVDGFYKLKADLYPTGRNNYWILIQKMLDNLGFGFDTYWIISYESILSSNSGLESFNIIGSGSAYEQLNQILSTLNCQIFQDDERWYIVERSVSTYTRNQELPSYQYKVATSTYTITTIASALSTNQIIFDNNIIDGATLDIIPALNNFSIKVEFDNIKSQSFVNELHGLNINDYDEIFENWDTSDPDITVSESTGAGSFDAGWCVIDGLSLLGKIESEWFGVANVIKYDEVGLSFKVDAKALLPDSDETGNTYTLDYLQVRFVTDGGNIWYLKEDGTWSTSVENFTFSYQANAFVPSSLTENFDFNIDLPTTSDSVFWIEVDIKHNGDISQYNDIGVSPITMVINTDLSKFVSATATNNTGNESINQSITISSNTTKSPTGIYETNSVSYKSKYYKLADITALKKSAQQHTPLRRLKGGFNEYDINPLNTYEFSSDLYRLQAWNEDVFNRQAELVLTEYDYDETNITLRRGIYS